jgi:hypothetical protein
VSLSHKTYESDYRLYNHVSPVGMGIKRHNAISNASLWEKFPITAIQTHREVMN